MKLRTASVCLTLVALVGALYLHHSLRASSVAAQSRASAQAPIFEVDPYWPKPLPNHWVLGSTIGLSVDAQDHVWVIHRPQAVEDNFKAVDFTSAIEGQPLRHRDVHRRARATFPLQRCGACHESQSGRDLASKSISKSMTRFI